MRLLVLYDSHCPFCAWCREWLEAREQEAQLVFLCCRSQPARARFGSIPNLGRELTIVDEQGRFWIGPEAFLVCGWALSSYRWLAWIGGLWGVWPITRVVFGMIAESRGYLSGWFGPPCTGEQCGLPPARSPYR